MVLLNAERNFGNGQLQKKSLKSCVQFIISVEMKDFMLAFMLVLLAHKAYTYTAFVTISSMLIELPRSSELFYVLSYILLSSHRTFKVTEWQDRTSDHRSTATRSIISSILGICH